MITQFQHDSTSVLHVGSYWLRPLLTIRKDDIQALLGPQAGVYMCNCPEQLWFEHFDIPGDNYQATVDKKDKMFSQLGPGSVWISPTTPVRWGEFIRTWQSPRMLHLGAGPLAGRAAQIIHTLQLMWHLSIRRSSYRYILMYNLYLPVSLAGVYARYILRKRLYVEYEDDYTKRRKSRLKNMCERLLRKACNGAICVHDDMASYFRNKPVAVCNGFADLSYAESCDYRFREGMTFLFGGTLDDIRGVDLIPELVGKLRSMLKSFHIHITGSGPLRTLVESWNIPEVTYRGVLDEHSYNALIADIDACLILQKPDHPFSQGSFPSKVEHYAKHKKPIFVLAMA